MAGERPERDVLAEALREARWFSRKTLRTLGDEVGADFTYLSKIERGHDRPSRDLVARLDIALNANGSLVAVFDSGPCPRCGHTAPSPDQLPREALDVAIENLLGTARPLSSDVSGITAWELAAQRLRIAYRAYRGEIKMCPVPSSVTGQPCLLPDGHPQDSGSRFHRYAAAMSPQELAAIVARDAAIKFVDVTPMKTRVEAAFDDDWLRAIRDRRALLALLREPREALARLANVVLDRPFADPDDDAAKEARAVLRLVERWP